MKVNDITYKVTEISPIKEQSFDLELWLADLLIDYWLSDNQSSLKVSIDE